MSPINYEALRSGDTNASLPSDGKHAATLERAALVATSKGDRLVTEWREADGQASWSSWNRFDETGLTYTVELLDGLGVDRATLTNDSELTAQLDKAVGHMFDVKTDTKAGSQGDRFFTSTYVDGRTLGIQASLTDAPADTTGMPTAGVTNATPALADDESIPF